MSTDISIRWLIRRDMPRVLAIDDAACLLPWDEQDYLDCLRQWNCIGMVAERESCEPLGVMIYGLHKTRLHISRMAVDPLVQRQGIGRAMVERLTDKLSHQRRSAITAEVWEREAGGHLFLRACGFRGCGLSRGGHEPTGEDTYLFRWHIDQDLPRPAPDEREHWTGAPRDHRGNSPLDDSPDVWIAHAAQAVRLQKRKRH